LLGQAALVQHACREATLSLQDLAVLSGLATSDRPIVGVILRHSHLLADARVRRVCHKSRFKLLMRRDGSLIGNRAVHLRMVLVLRPVVTVVIELLLVLGGCLLVLSLKGSHNLELAVRRNRGTLLRVRDLRLGFLELELGGLAQLGRVDIVNCILRLQDARILKLGALGTHNGIRSSLVCHVWCPAGRDLL
jgi:hypothetical protein